MSLADVRPWIAVDRRPRWGEVALWSVLVACIAADAATTAYAVGVLGLVEFGPVVAAVIDVAGLPGLVAMKAGSVVLLLALWLLLDDRQLTALAVVTGLMALVVANNLASLAVAGWVP